MNFSSFLVIRFRYIVIFAVVPIVVALVVKVSVAVVLLLLFKHFFGPTSQTRRGVEKAFNTFDFAWVSIRNVRDQLPPLTIQPSPRVRGHLD